MHLPTEAPGCIIWSESLSLSACDFYHCFLMPIKLMYSCISLPFGCGMSLQANDGLLLFPQDLGMEYYVIGESFETSVPWDRWDCLYHLHHDFCCVLSQLCANRVLGCHFSSVGISSDVSEFLLWYLVFQGCGSLQECQGADREGMQGQGSPVHPSVYLQVDVLVNDVQSIRKVFTAYHFFHIVKCALFQNALNSFFSPQT